VDRNLKAGEVGVHSAPVGRVVEFVCGLVSGRDRPHSLAVRVKLAEKFTRFQL